MKNWYVNANGILMPIQDALGNGIISFLVVITLGTLIFGVVIVFNLALSVLQIIIESGGDMLNGQWKSALSRLIPLFVIGGLFAFILAYVLLIMIVGFWGCQQTGLPFFCG